MGQYLAGAAKTDITPQVGCHLTGYFQDRIAEQIHDPLFAKAIAISDGANTIGLVCLHLLGIPDYVCVEAKNIINAETGVPVENVLISAVHTHTAPSISGLLGTPPQTMYIKSLPRKIADAFKAAMADMRPAEIAHARGNCTEECHNRRWHMKDGSVRMNPACMSPDAIKPAGPTDPELGMLIIREKETRKPIAVYSNLSLHYVGNGRGNWVSADYFEEYAVALQRIAGDDFLVIMANGCQGDINNIDFMRPPCIVPPELGPYYRQHQVANVIAAESWKAWSLLREDQFASQGEIAARNTWVPFKSRKATQEEYDAAMKLYLSFDQSNFTDWIYARELVLMPSTPQNYDILVQSLHIGDLAIVGLNGEVFVEFGLAIKAASPFQQTFTVALANGYNGYTATNKALDEGSYETKLCRHVRTPKDTGNAWVKAAVKDLYSMIG